MANAQNNPPPYYGLPTYHEATRESSTTWVPGFDLRPFPTVMEGDSHDYMILDAVLAVKMTDLLAAIRPNIPSRWRSTIWDSTLSIQPGDVIPMPTGPEWYPQQRQTVAIFWFLGGDKIYNLKQLRPGVFQMENRVCGHNINGVFACDICRICRLLVDSCALNAQTMPDSVLVQQMYEH